MKILERRVYRGPNLYAHFPVVRLTLDLGELEHWPSAKIPGFVEALLEALPSLREHGCSYATEGGFLRRLQEGEGTWLGHVLEHVAIEIQNRAGADVTFGKTRGTGNPGEYFVVYEFEEERVGEAAGRLKVSRRGPSGRQTGEPTVSHFAEDEPSALDRARELAAPGELILLLLHSERDAVDAWLRRADARPAAW